MLCFFYWAVSLQLKRHSVVHRIASATDSDESDESQQDESDSNHRRRFFRYTLTTAASSIMVLPTAPAAAVLAADAVTPIAPTPPFSRDLYWPLGKVAFSLLPLTGGSRRATVEECVVPDKIWTHDQLQGIVNVNVPVRQTVIALERGGLWVHNPVAPTCQLLKMMRSLEDKYGPVKHICLGTVALERKATLGPFAQNFRQATVWIQPGIVLHDLSYGTRHERARPARVCVCVCVYIHASLVAFTIFRSPLSFFLSLSLGQWSFPLNLPICALGVTQKGPQLRELPGPDPPPARSRVQQQQQRMRHSDAEPPNGSMRFRTKYWDHSNCDPWEVSVRPPFFTNPRPPSL